MAAINNGDTGLTARNKINAAIAVVDNLNSTHEQLANKAIDFVVVNNVKYPTIQAVVNFVSNPANITQDVTHRFTTDTEKAIWNANIHFRGKYLTLVALQTAVPVGLDGDYSIVDPGGGTDAIEYIWDANEGWVKSGMSAQITSVNGMTGPVVVLTTTNIAEGTNLYYTAARFNLAFAGKSTTDLAEGTNLYFLASRVLATVLTGFVLTDATAVVTTDTIVQAFGKLQRQINDNVVNITNNSNSLKVHFGDGSDGNVTISVNTTLTNNMNYNDLTVNVGVVLTTAGFKIYVKGTLTNNGTIGSVGQNATNGGNGTVAAGGAAGSGGAQGSVANEFNASGGANGVAGGSIAPGNGVAGVASANGNNIVMKDQAGPAGNGGAGLGSTGATGGAAGTSAIFGAFKSLVHNFIFGVAKPVTARGGSSGASGGGSLLGGGGGSGGGGGTPYSVAIYAFNLINNGIIRSNGGNAGNGGNGFGNAGGAGGGNGGIGGYLYLVYKTITVGTLQVNGGTAGAAGNGAGSGANGTAGTAGVAGTIVRFNLTDGTITTT